MGHAYLYLITSDFTTHTSNVGLPEYMKKLSVFGSWGRECTYIKVKLGTVVSLEFEMHHPFIYSLRMKTIPIYIRNTKTLGRYNLDLAFKSMFLTPGRASCAKQEDHFRQATMCPFYE